MFNKLNLSFKKATINDCNTLIDINNKSYYDDYIRYGYCPGYNITADKMKLSLEDKNVEKNLVYLDSIPVGSVSIRKLDTNKYYLSNLCIIPEYQHKGIGKATIDFILNHYTDLMELSLITPADKIENVNFYTHKCNFTIVGKEMDGSVQVFKFKLKR